ncbi:MAG: Ig-like domain-containing protein, partial [Thaumarchaeota archaeon]|nr:Ig-like domain-containing protein [Nitrososphaerota archaeon]
GVLWYNSTFTSDFTLSFMYKIGGGSGADGIVAMFYKQNNYTAPGTGQLPNNCGGCLGWVGNGYGVEFDTYQNSWDPTSDEVALIQNGVANHLIYTSDPRTDDNLWHNATIQVGINSVRVSIDSSEVWQYNSTLDRTYGGFGFTGSTGASTDLHEITNVSLTYQSPPPSYTLEARVGNSSSPIAGAVVTAGRYSSTTYSSTTNASGYAAFLLPYGSYNVSASYPGYENVSTIADMDSNQSISLTFPSPYVIQGVLPSSDISVNLVPNGYNITILNPFASSSADVFFDWKNVGMLPAAGEFSFISSGLPNLVIVGASEGSADYPKAWYANPLPVTLPPTNGTTGPFLAEPFPYAAASIFVNPYPPVIGQLTTIGVTLHNPSDQQLNISRVDFQLSGLTIGGFFTTIGMVNNVTLAPNETLPVSIQWTATVSGHHCVRVVLSYGDHATSTIQRNLDIENGMALGSTGSVTFTLVNPSASPSDITLDALPNLPTGWSYELYVNGAPDSYESNTYTDIAAGATLFVTLMIISDSSNYGQGSVDIQGYINGQLIGGVRKTMSTFPSTLTSISLSANPSTVVETNELQSSTITATALDQNNNPMPNVQITLSSSSPGVLSTSSVKTGPNGEAQASVSLQESISQPVTVTISASSGSVAAVPIQVTFTAQASAICPLTESWMSCSAFLIQSQSITIPSAVSSLLPTICTPFTNTCYTPPNPLTSSNLNNYPIDAYSIMPACSTSSCMSEYQQEMSVFFGVSDSGYQLTSAYLIHIPMISLLNALIQDIPFTGSFDLQTQTYQAGLDTTIAGLTPYLQTTSQGDLNFLITVWQGTSSNAQSVLEASGEATVTGFVQGLLSTILGVIKENPVSLADTLSGTLNSIAGTYGQSVGSFAAVGDAQLSLVTSNISATGQLSSNSIFNFAQMINAIVSLASDLSNLTGIYLSLLQLVYHLILAIFEAPTLVLLIVRLGQALVDAINVVVQALSFIPSISSNSVYKAIASAIGWVESVTDPSNSTIVPTFYTENGTFALGYDPSNGQIVYGSQYGFLIATNETYYAYLYENASTPTSYTSTLNALGAENTAVPFEIDIMSYNKSSLPILYAGILITGTTKSLVILPNSEGAIMQEPTLAPKVILSGGNGDYAISAIPYFRNGTLTSASGFYVIINGIEYKMNEENSSSFSFTLKIMLQKDTLAYVYGISSGAIGGVAVVLLTTNAPMPVSSVPEFPLINMFELSAVMSSLLPVMFTFLRRKKLGRIATILST